MSTKVPKNPLTKQQAKSLRQKLHVVKEPLTPESTCLVDLRLAFANPRTARLAVMLGLQHQYGNNPLQRMLAKPNIQTRLIDGVANDALEQEVDHMPMVYSNLNARKRC